MRIENTWNHPAVITKNNFVYKSLSCWSLNIAIGCGHKCLFCSVPSTSTRKMTHQLEPLGVSDPDAEWGEYVFIRQWDEKRFRASLKLAENTPRHTLNQDGNRAVILCSTTDPYQTLSTPELNDALHALVRRALEIILQESTLNVRILTRSPLARRDFDLFKQFGSRLLFGMSVPTANNQLARVYEPKAPAPTQRLATLKAARDAGIHTFVAVAPTYPECQIEDMMATLNFIQECVPVTIFHEPINIRAENVARIEKHANALGVELAFKDVFQTSENWRMYAITSLRNMEFAAKRMGLYSRLHLWPDASLGSKLALEQYAIEHPDEGYSDHYGWLQKWWNRVSEWPQEPTLL